MNVMSREGSVEVIVVGMGPGELLLESIMNAIRERDIRNGVVVSGIGTLKTCRMHYIKHTDFPPEDAIFKLEQPLELLSVSGVIADGEPHLHAVVSHADREAQGGHVEPGCEVAYLAEIVIHKFNDLEMKRHFDEKRRIKLLGPRR
ncbi:DNA-binding protein [Candidatus Poribacteria bacterium]|nr:DNA-binding protein [Candidatus Poribacteria bacterium]